MTSSKCSTSDELAIRTLVAQYVDAVIRRDASDFRATWAPDGVWNLAGREAKGEDEIVALWERVMARYDLVLQMVHSGTVNIDDGCANGRWYLTELNRQHGGSGAFMAGVYDDAYVRLGDGWRFSSRHFSLLYGGASDLLGTGIAVGTDAVREPDDDGR